MTIMYPLNKPVTVEDMRTKANSLLERKDEWAPWEALVLQEINKNAEIIHKHYMYHVWYEVEGLGHPDIQTARDELMLAANYMFSKVDAQHVDEAVIHQREWLEENGITAPKIAAVLVSHAFIMIDDFMESLRFGPTAIESNIAYGFEMPDWMDILKFEDELVRLPGVDNAWAKLSSRISDIGTEAFIDTDKKAWNNIVKRHDNQKIRNNDRILTAIKLTNENYSIPASFELKLSDVAGFQGATIITWGLGHNPPERMEELVTRPSGETQIPLQENILGELRPMMISEIAKIGRYVALSIGRDAEIRSTGNLLSKPPIWCWAGPLPLINHVLERLRRGEDVDVSKGGMTPGPLLSAENIVLGDGKATYSYDSRTLDEVLTINQAIPDTMVYACVGNPVSVLVKAPMFDDARITIQACEVDGSNTEFEILSPIVRLAPAPDGYNESPEVAWIGMLENFDEQAVYGDRIYREKANAVSNFDIPASRY